MLLEGIFLPVTTPFHPDGRVFAQKLETNVDRYGRTPAAGLIVLGEPAEAERLTDDERKLVLESAIAASAPHQVMLAGVNHASVHGALGLIEVAARAGYDAVAVTPAWPHPAHRQQLFMEVVLDRSPLPVIIVEEGLHLPIAVLARLLAHSQAIGAMGPAALGQLKTLRELTAGVTQEVTVTTVFAAVTGRMRRQAAPAAELLSADALVHGAAATGSGAAQVGLKTRTKRVGLQFLQTRNDAVLSALEGGASGAAPTLGACIPQACCEIYQAFRDEDPALAQEKSARLARVAAAFPFEEHVARIKYGCDLNGYFGGRPRLPELPLTGEQRVAIEAALAGIRN